VNHFAKGFQDELEKLAVQAPVHWAVKALPVLEKTMTPAIFTGGLGAIIGSRVSDDPAKGAAQGALIGTAAGMLPGALHEVLIKRYPELGQKMLEGMPNTLAGAGIGASVGGLVDDDNRARGAAIGALGGGALLGIPTYLGMANRPPTSWYG
jgi:hypothetical protein